MRRQPRVGCEKQDIYYSFKRRYFENGKSYVHIYYSIGY